MQNPNVHPWSWGQGPSGPAVSGVRPVMPAQFPPTGADQNQMMSGYQQVYGNIPMQQSDYAQWTSAQLQQWQQWQQWQEKYRQWQNQYGKKFEESLAAYGQNQQASLSGIPPAMNAQRHFKPPLAPAPPLPVNSQQPVPPPPPEEEKPPPPATSEKEADRTHKNGCRDKGDYAEDLSEAEKTFDIQFKQWESQFNAWKKENQDHPDKAQYKEYEKKWETWREQLLKRREQMRKKRLSQVSADTGSNSFVPGKSEEINKKDGGIKGQSDRLNLNANESNGLEVPKHVLEQPSGNPPSMHPTKAPSSDFEQRNHLDKNQPFKANRSTFPFDYRGSSVGEKEPGYDMSSLGNSHREEFGFTGENFSENQSKGFGKRPNSRNFDEWVKEENLEARSRNAGCKEASGSEDQSFDSLYARQRVGNGGDNNPSTFTAPQKHFFGNSGSQQNFDYYKNKDTCGSYGVRKSASDGFEDFRQGQGHVTLGNKPKVPSLFDITVEKPQGFMNSNVEKKQKIWEKWDFGDSTDPMSKEGNRETMDRFRGNNRQPKGNSPWLQPWEHEKMKSGKFQESRWNDGGTSNSLYGNNVFKKEEIDRVELSGYVGNILAKLGHFGGTQTNIGASFPEKNFPGFTKNNKDFGESSEKDSSTCYEDTNFESKCWNQNSSSPNRCQVSHYGLSDAKGEEFQGMSEGAGPQNPARNHPGQFGLDESAQFPAANVPLKESHFRGLDRNSEGIDPVYRDQENADSMRTMSEDDRRNSANENKTFGRGDSRFSCRTSREDRGFANDRFGNLRNGRRNFERFDRDEREPRGNVDKTGRKVDRLPNEPLWNPQVFDYSRGRLSRLNDFEKGFKISTVVDYSHGESKQTFDYGHGGGSSDAADLKSFEYGHGVDFPTVIDYAHGVKVEPEAKKDKTKEDRLSFPDKGKMLTGGSLANFRRSPAKNRMRSPCNSPTGRHQGGSSSPPFKDKRLKGRDGPNRPKAKRGRRNSEEKSSGDSEVSKHSFDVTTVLVEDLICLPGRETRPNKLVFIMRGIPGSGKTYVTKLIKDKEIEAGGDPPRILSLDDYFMTEVEKEKIDEDTGRKVKTKVLEYEYEAAVESHYRGSLVKAFKKTVSDGFFSFIIVDSVNEKTQDYEEMWSFAKQKGFQVYIAEMDNDVTVCTGRNIHKRTEKEISDLAKAWEETPPHYLRLDVRSLLQADAITEVEMEVVSDTEGEKNLGKEKKKEEAKEMNLKEGSKSPKDVPENPVEEEEDEPGSSTFVQSRWDKFEHSEQNLDRLDGLKRRREGFHATMEDYLQLADDLDECVRDSVPGKKRVRWADLEERRQQEKMRAIGFVVGQTDWSRMTDPTFGEGALTRTKYI